MDYAMNFFNNNKHSLFSLIGGLLSVFLIKRYFNGPQAKKSRDMKNKVVIITGASGGIGKETALQLLQDGARVFFACRSKERTEEIINNIKNEDERKRAHFISLNLEDFESIKNFVEEFKKKDMSIDILINNAATVSKSFKLLKNGIEETMGVNTISPIVLTQLLLPLFNENGRIINLASKGYQRVKYDSSKLSAIKAEEYDFEPHTYSGFKNYCYSKLGNIYFTQYLHNYIKEKGLKLKTASLHPGVIATELMRDYSSKISLRILFALIYPLFWLMTKNSWRGAQTTLELCYTNDSDFQSGQYYSDCEVQNLMSHGQDELCMKAYMALVKGLIDNKGKSSGIKFELTVG
jgi:NAD(P)-dependent dehydrogenase (short-subunit alcohol dehydrogenase family)